MSNRLLAGRYELIEKIGDGGMAVVYKSKDRLLNRYVAVKILRPEFTGDAQFIESFRKESQAAAGLSHPNIVNVYDVGKEGNIYFIVMELVDGRPLSEIIEEQGPMDYKVVIEIGKQIAAALNLAHNNHIIHRDVKPHNIMMTKDGVAKLADFGIAKAVSNATIVNKESRQVMGSVHYFSPEQARGKYVDERSDVYSLGIVLYEMITGQVPFDGENPVEIALMHINEEIKTPSSIVSDFPPALEKIIMKATDKYQNNRYANAGEMYEDLNNLDFLARKVGDATIIADNRRHPVHIDDNSDELEKLIDEKPVKKKKKRSGEKRKTPLIIGIVILALLVLGGGYYALSKAGIIGGKEVEVPDLQGYTYEEARDALSSLKLEIKKGKNVASADVEKGQVASQTPIAGTKAKEGSTVTVNISKGKSAGLVPNLVGTEFGSETALSEMLSTYGFKIGGIKYEESETYDEGIITSQSPGAGSKAKAGSRINIVVSKGKKQEKAKVPSLTRLSSNKAVQALKDAGLSVGDITYEESNLYEKDQVMWQQYSEGTELKKGTSVSIKISKGVLSVPAPNEEPSTNIPGGAPEGSNSI